MSRAELSGNLQRRDNIESRGNAGKDSFLAREAAGHHARFGLADGTRFVVNVGGEMRRHEADSHPFHAMRSAAAGGDGRPRVGLEGDDPGPDGLSAFDTPASIPAVPTPPQNAGIFPTCASHSIPIPP